MNGVFNILERLISVQGKLLAECIDFLPEVNHSECNLIRPCFKSQMAIKIFIRTRSFLLECTQQTRILSQFEDFF